MIIRFNKPGSLSLYIHFNMDRLPFETIVSKGHNEKNGIGGLT